MARIEPASIQFSEEDSDLRSLRWWANGGGYARRNRRADGTRKSEMAHRIVLSRALGRPLAAADICDHIDRDRLNNRRENLRLTSPAGNARNRTPFGAAGLLGVGWHRRAGKWQASFCRDGVHYYCGVFDSAIAAKSARDLALQAWDASNPQGGAS